MERNMKTITFLVVLACSSLAYGQSSITAAEAKNHVGENATVCGQVESAHYAARTRGNPTFINLDKPYPDPIFTIVIWGSERPKFGTPEETYSGKHICVTGRITLYRGAPETTVSEPSQIKVQ
jgi:DNA/RNA endonuclease YhcR with UshA esterase domain